METPEENPVSRAIETQRAVFAAEMYWLGGLRDQLGSRACHSAFDHTPILVEQEGTISEQPGEGNGTEVRYQSFEDGTWNLTFDEVESEYGTKTGSE